MFTSCDEDDVIRSSEANITSFTFDTTVAANAAVLSQPVIDEANATITFKAEEDGDVSALVPTIEVSAGATVTPASGSAVSFASGSATFTVVAEDGTSYPVRFRNMGYSRRCYVSRSGKSRRLGYL